MKKISAPSKNKERLKIFVSAYACEPHLGSEIGVGWHWVLEMSKYFELWVLTRESNRHTIEPWIDKHPAYKNIHWLYYDWPKWARFWKKGLRGVRTYYNIWQVCTNHIVKRTMQENDIRIFHHLTYGNALWKVSSYGQKQFFIWGPVGGLETVPIEFSKHYGLRNRILESVRRMVVTLLPLNFGLKRRCQRADLILCKTAITRDRLPNWCRYKAAIQTDVAVDSLTDTVKTNHVKDDILRLITVGRLDSWRGFDLCIESLAEALKEKKGILLTIVGNGSDELRLRNLAKSLDVSQHVNFAGRVSADEYRRLMLESDVVVNASLKEGAVTVSFDSMAIGKPLICIDTTGYTRYYDNNYSLKIPLSDRKQTILYLKDAIVSMTDEPLRIEMGKRNYEIGQQLTWEERGKEIVSLFNHYLHL